jgi:acyl-CoA thioesterase YciA
VPATATKGQRVASGEVAAWCLVEESATTDSRWSNMPEISSEDALAAVSGIAPLTLPNDRQLVMRVMPMPADANGNGDIFGGWIMAQVDLAGAVLPARIAKGRIVTVAVNQFIFKQPVSMGDLLSFYARVERIGKTSVTVNIEVFAERNPADLHVVKVTEANVTYVAIDGAGRPRPIPRG